LKIKTILHLTFVVLALVAAQNAWARPFCTSREVKGTYAFLANGSVLVPNTPITGPFMRIGSFKTDGAGGVVFSTLAIYNGINFGPEHFTGTYSVQSDCTIDLHVAVPIPINANVEFKGQVAENGNDVAFMLIDTDSPQAPPISTVVGFGKKRRLAHCSDDDLAGNWRIELNGFRNLPPTGTGTAYRHVGQIQADGTGGLLASFITSDNGAISQETAGGAYTVSPDCTFDLNYTLGGAPYSIRGSLINEGEAFAGLNMPGQEVANLGIVTGAVATGSMVRQSNSHENVER
jgi:hypothetical protein